jgi:hypothetical protein
MKLRAYILTRLNIVGTEQLVYIATGRKQLEALVRKKEPELFKHNMPIHKLFDIEEKTEPGEIYSYVY